MNKISKKIVALVTMAAFVLTLVPAAAFAEPGDENTPGKQDAIVVTDGVSANASKITIDGSTEADVVAGDEATIDFSVNTAMVWV